VNLPTYVAGDRVVVCVSCADTLAADITGVDGFTELKTSANAERGAVYQRIMDGTEGSTVDVSLAAAAQTAVAIAFVHRGLDWTVYTTDVASAFATSSVDPPQVNLSHGEGSTYDVYIFWGGVDASGQVQVTTPSSGYTELVDENTGPGDTSAGLMHKQITGATSEDPGVYVINTGTTDCLTFAIVAQAATGSVAAGDHEHAIDDLTDVDTTTDAPDVGQVLKWDGTNWVPDDDDTGGGGGGAFGELAFTTPPTAGWSWVNQGTTTVATDSDGSILLAKPATAANDLTLRVRSHSSSTTVTARLSGDSIGIHAGWGLALRESSTGKLVIFYLKPGGTLLTEYWTSATVFSSGVGSAKGLGSRPHEWFQIEDDGTNLKFRWSSVGYAGLFSEHLSVSRTAFLAGGPDEVGLLIRDNSLAAAVAAGSWSVV
jgi:hypothetical protein